MIKLHDLVYGIDLSLHIDLDYSLVDLHVVQIKFYYIVQSDFHFLAVGYGLYEQKPESININII